MERCETDIRDETTLLEELPIALLHAADLDDVLRLIARHVMSALNYADCVIYVREADDTLVQRAAWGPKSPDGTEIVDPLRLEFGEGIVGSAAAEMAAICIVDTDLDARYVGDVGGGRSELAVPIMFDGRVLGVIDSEHPDPGFYTEQDAAIITSIAAIAAAQMHSVITTQALEATITELAEARDAVAHSEQRLVSLVANVSDVITVMRADGTWVSSSGAGTRLLGYETGFDPEGGIFSLVHPDDVAIAQTAFTEVVAGTRTSADPIDLRVRGVDGTWHVLETVAENLIDDPSIDGLVLTSRDVTQQRTRAAELRETSSRLSALVASLGDGVLFVNKDQRIVFTNRAFCSIFGYPETPSELVGQPTSAIRPHADALVVDSDWFGALIDEHLARREPALGGEVELNDGRTLQRDYIPVEIGDERFGDLWLYRDITARKSLNAARERLLDVERGLREEAEAQAQALQEIADLKTELVAMVSHELRTPLTSIVSFADLLLADDRPPDEAEQREFVTVIDRNAKRLIRLVDDLLLLGQLESGVTTIEPKDCSAEEVVRWAVDSAGHRASEAGVAVGASVEPGPPLHADPGRVGQVLDNLLSNAIKFSDSGGRVEVTARHDGGAWIVAVTDDGVGIPKAEQNQLFESFFRAPGTAQSIPGTGLGLAICKTIIELHGGTIGVESREGNGASFEFVIPDGRRVAR